MRKLAALLLFCAAIGLAHAASEQVHANRPWKGSFDLHRRSSVSATPLSSLELEEGPSSLQAESEDASFQAAASRRSSAPLSHHGKDEDHHRKSRLPGFGSAKYAVVIGCDGLGGMHLTAPLLPSWVKLPTLDRLKEEGTWTLTARAVLPTWSKPNWGAMLTGVGPEINGVLDNDWKVGTELEPVTGNNTFFPSIFQVIHDQTNGSFAQAAYTDWGGFLDLWPAGLVKYEKLYDAGYPNATLMAQNVINNLVGKARFIYVHLDDIDHAGHTQGFGTDEYYKTVQDVDAAIGEIIAALARAHILSDTFLMVVSDHGGEGTTHGISDALNAYVPLYMAGPHVRANNMLPCPNTDSNHTWCYSRKAKLVTHADQPATVLHALGFRQPIIWQGRALLEAFE